jgi:hypothetical protein
VKPFHLDIINLAKHNEEEKHKWTRGEHDYISILKEIKGINKRLMKAKLKHYKNIKKKSKNMILIWKPRCLNAWQMPPFIGQNSKLLIWWLIIEWMATSWLGDNPYLLV